MAKNVNHYREYSGEYETIEEGILDTMRAITNKFEAEDLQQQMVDDTAEKYKLSEDEIEDFLCKSYADKESVSAEYLVDGAILTCTNCTAGDIYVQNKYAPPLSYEAIIMYKYSAPIDESIDKEEIPNVEDKVLGRLKVTENPKAENNLLKFATIKDCVQEKNIPYFGNCKRKPDSKMEMEIFSAIHEEEKETKSFKKREEGTCKYLMKLESEWENYEIVPKFLEFIDDEKGKQSGITMTSMLFCKHGGFIYPITSGQNVNVMTLEIALDKMTQYLNGENISDEELDKIIEYVAYNCGLKVNEMVQGQFSKKVDESAYDRSQAYDSQIIAWTYYWNKKIENEFTYQFEINPNIVKAIIAQESSFGNGDINKAKNPSRNVMQSLSTGNSTVWVASGINPYDNSVFKFGDNISYKMLDGTICTDGSLPVDNLYKFTASEFNRERQKMHLEDFDVLKKIFEEDNGGKYMVVFENVTTNMSIATGVGLLAYKIEDNKDIYTGVAQYNTKPGYVDLINGHLEDMGAEKIINDF